MTKGVDQIVLIGQQITMSDEHKRLKLTTTTTTDVHETTASPVEENEDEPSRLSTMTIEQEKAMHEALHNPLVLYKIIGELDYLNSFTASRLVNKIWNCVSSEIMLKRDCCHVELAYDPKLKIYHRQLSSGQILNESQHLHHLNKVLDKSPNFPCTHFDIWEGRGSLANKDIQNLFQLYGKKMKTLKLEKTFDTRSSTSKQVFKNILVEQAPTIEVLKVRNFEYNWDQDELHHHQGLSSLKIFDWAQCPQTALAIIQSSSNLQSVMNHSNNNTTNDLKVLLDSGKVSTVKVHQLNVDGTVDVDRLTVFANAGGQVEHLSFLLDSDYRIDLAGQRVTEYSVSFEKLLNSTKDSLLHLNLCGATWASCNVKFPQLTSLNLLKLGHSLYEADVCVPLGTNFDSTFSNLCTLDCSNLLCRKDSNWELHFPPDPDRGTLSSVSTLILSENCTEQWMPRLLGLCPNFKKFVINTLLPFRKCFKTTLLTAFKSWPQLESIIIKTQEIRLGYFNLDSVITGMPESSCDWLFNHHQQSEDSVIDTATTVAGQWRTGPSLRELQGLKHFKIVVDPSVYPASADYSVVGFHRPFRPCPFSSVSTFHAFKLMPELKLTVQFDHSSPRTKEIQAAFDPLSPYVNFVHKHGCSDLEGN